MDIIQINVNKQKLTVKAPCKLVAGTIGKYGVKVTYDEEWSDAPYRLLMFKGCETIKREDKDDVITLPYESIEKPCYLQFGVIGLDGNGEVRITTYSDSKENMLEVMPSDWRGDSTEDIVEPPTPTIWEELKLEIAGYEKQVKELAGEVEKIKQSGTGGSIVVDAELSTESENPVQNKVITQKFGELSKEIVDVELQLSETITDIEDRINVGSSNEEITDTAIVRNGYYSASGKTWYEYSAAWTVDKIPVELGDTIIAIGQAADGIAFAIGFDENDEPVIVYDIGIKTEIITKEYKIGIGVKSISVSSVYANKLKVFKKNAITVKQYVDTSLSEKAISSETYILKNIVNSEDVVNKYITTTGYEYEFADARSTGYIDINICDMVYYTGNASDTGIVCWIVYDSLKTVINRLNGSSATTSVKNYEINLAQIRQDNPSAKYIRFCSVYSTNLVVSGLCKVTSTELVDKLKASNVLFGKKYVACGDSFTEGLFGAGYDEYYDNIRQMWKTYPWYIAERNNMTLINEAKSGTTMWNDGNNAFSDARYKNIPTDADYITLMFGLNETDAVIGTLQDETTETVMGAWNVVLEYLITNHPYAKIGIIIADSWLTEELHDALIQIAEYWGISYLDLRDDAKISMGINGRITTVVNQKAKELRDNAFKMSNDNAHPNPKAHEYRSTIIEHWLRSL